MGVKRSDNIPEKGAVQLVYVTAANREEALALARTVVTERLAACANVVDAMHSIYWWDDALQEETETVLILKTRRERVADLTRRIQDLHSYDCPCVAALEIGGGNADFLNWVIKNTAQ